MSWHAYQEARGLLSHSFEGLLFAAMARAGTVELDKLASAFPQQWEELRSRFNSPGGWTRSEMTMKDESPNPNQDPAPANIVPLRPE